MINQTKEAFEIDLEEIISKEHQIVLYNDDVNTFDYVINLLVKVCGHDVIQAEQCAFLVHYKGKCVVKKGAFEDLKPMHEALSSKGLTVEVE
ncbi:MAG: ATP-dependent Clp protease adaptor ClpS [Vicingus serpentipes]|nr:ATP-dependent Clp protease adaptor ClpS [Vicingus serpentipes]